MGYLHSFKVASHKMLVNYNRKKYNEEVWQLHLNQVIWMNNVS